MRISDCSSDVCSSDLRSGRSRDRREHQFPLQSEAFDRPCDETGRRSRALRQDANRMAIGNHALHPVLSFRAEAWPHHDLSTDEVLLDQVPELAPEAVDVRKLYQVFSPNADSSEERRV